MSKIYCHQCGKQLSIMGNFCPFCGTNLKSLTQQTVAKSNSTTFEPFLKNIDDEDDDYIDRINKLDIKINRLEIDISNVAPPQETIGNIAGTATKIEKINILNLPTQSNESILADFLREAGPIQRKTDNGQK